MCVQQKLLKNRNQQQCIDLYEFFRERRLRKSYEKTPKLKGEVHTFGKGERKYFIQI